MPIAGERAREIVHRRTAEIAGEEARARLAPVPRTARSIPPGIPRSLDWAPAGVAERVAFLEARSGAALAHLAGRAAAVEPETLRGNIEHFIGMTQVPTGAIGPLRVNGLHAYGDFYVPLATSEGALVASYDRGARLLTHAGGAVCLTTAEQVQRAPGFAFGSLGDAAHFATWAVGEVDRFREIVARGSRYARLTDMLTQVEANNVYLVFAFHTGDAAGQNMATFATAAICADIIERAPVAPRYWFVESNMSGDKKATAMSFLQTRGRNVSAEAILPARLVRRGLRTTPERMCDYWRMSFVAGVQTGSIGVSGHAANAIAALFLACGQDVACVAEAAVGITRLEMEGADLRCAVTLPNLIVGTIGGGTRLPTQRECLALLDCLGEGSAARFAEICAATVLAGEISIIGALCAGEFASAHARLGRPAAPESGAESVPDPVPECITP